MRGFKNIEPGTALGVFVWFGVSPLDGTSGKVFSVAEDSGGGGGARLAPSGGWGLDEMASGDPSRDIVVAVSTLLRPAPPRLVLRLWPWEATGGRA